MQEIDVHERLHGLLCSGKYEVFSSFLQCFWDSQDDNLASDTSNRRVLHGSNAKEQLSLTDWGPGYVDICIDWRAWTVAMRCIGSGKYEAFWIILQGFWDSQDSNRRVLHGSNAKEQLSLTAVRGNHQSVCFVAIGWNHVFHYFVFFLWLMDGFDSCCVFFSAF